MIEQCVVRTCPKGWNMTTEQLAAKLKDGWIVKHITPCQLDRQDSGIEYILEREKIGGAE